MIGKNRIRRRAEKELAVVKATRDNFDDKARYFRDEVGVTKLQIFLNKERMVNLSDEEIDALVELERLIQLDELKLYQKEKQLQRYRSTLDLLEKLLYTLEIYYSYEDYRYIINIIPEKRLPKLVKDPNKIGEVYDLVLEMLKKFNTESQLFEIIEQEAKESQKREKEKTEITEDLYGSSQKNREKEALERRKQLLEQNTFNIKDEKNKKDTDNFNQY